MILDDEQKVFDIFTTRYEKIHGINQKHPGEDVTLDMEDNHVVFITNSGKRYLAGILLRNNRPPFSSTLS